MQIDIYLCMHENMNNNYMRLPGRKARTIMRQTISIRSITTWCHTATVFIFTNSSD